jgi:hypothetical protein
MENSNLICIKENHHPVIPPHLVLQEFGSETVVDNKTGKRLASGVSVYLSGPIGEIRSWIKAAGGKVWTSNNPMLGRWELMSLE